jgi:DNA mismatch endonuclease (patch repair protein)
MAHNRGHTNPEKAVASALWKKGLRYLGYKGYQGRYGYRLPGHPDLVFVGCRTVVFVDGCFWHGCSVCDTGIDNSSDFWKGKISTNRERDRRTTEQLEKDGWKVIRVFEHDIRTKVGLQKTTDRLADLICSLYKEVR